MRDPDTTLTAWATSKPAPVCGGCAAKPPYESWSDITECTVNKEIHMNNPARKPFTPGEVLM
jgi:hypothetical protein